jgi:hypothetical protein
MCCALTTIIVVHEWLPKHNLAHGTITFGNGGEDAVRLLFIHSFPFIIFVNIETHIVT